MALTVPQNRIPPSGDGGYSRFQENIHFRIYPTPSQAATRAALAKQEPPSTGIFSFLPRKAHQAQMYS